jgi:protein-disulfide isomerase
MRGLLIYSAAAVVIAAIVIAGAIILTSGKNNGPAAVGDLPSPNGPLASQITPTDLPTNGRTLGNANAAHTIDIWEDFQCPNCRLFTFTIEPQLIDNYVAKGQAKLVYHDWLVIDSGTGGHESLDAANAALCASDQGKFWPFHDWLFTNQFQEGSGAFTKDRIKGMASMMGGLDLNKFDSCVDSGTHNADVKTESSKPPAGATGTPAVLVDGKLTTSYDYATVSDALNQVLGITPSPSVAASASASSSTSASPAPVSTPAVSAPPATTPSASPSAS